jgi:hypothetical protein
MSSTPTTFQGKFQVHFFPPRFTASQPHPTAPHRHHLASFYLTWHNLTAPSHSVIDGLRQVCAVASVILSNVSESQSAAASGAVKTNTADTAAQTTGTGGGSAPGSGAASLAQSQTAMLFGLGLSVVLALPAALL